LCPLGFALGARRHDMQVELERGRVHA
jgi:hypothetical protein